MSGPAVPLRQFVLKVASRCDLACDHCYVYEAADQSWRGQPKTMSDETVAWAARRIAEHAKAHELPIVYAVLHGGEPLLAGRAGLEHIATTLRSAVTGICDLDLRIHTNGVLLDEEFCDLFAACGVKVGISLDGDRAANDRHRRFASGRGSYIHVIKAIELLRRPRYRDLYAGLLCTIDVANDPVAVYESLMAQEPPRIDFLLPHANWDTPPARPGGAAAPYADWLIAIFDRWLADGRPVAIRTFESVISTSTGGESLTEALGLAPSDLAVIETDGTYEQADSLKSAYDKAPATGYDVIHHDIDEVARHPGILARQQGLDGLCATCRACPVVTSCGGGLYAHRYRSASGFDNPSVFCGDLLKLIRHIQVKAGHLGPRAGAGGPSHGVPAAGFDALAAGLGDAATLGNLEEAQVSLRRSLLSAVHQAAGVPQSAALDMRAAWEVLARLDGESPRAVADVLAHPYVRVWLVRCLERLSLPASDRAAIAAELATDLRHLGGITAAAAIRAHATARLRVPVICGAVHLPTLGRLVVDAAAARQQRAEAQPASPTMATVEVTPDTVTVRAGARRWNLARTEALGRQPAPPAGWTAGWEPVRHLVAGDVSVTLEDTDPFRDCHQWAAAPRLSDAEFADWCGGFAAAWAQITRDHGAYAPGLAAGLRVITPLCPAPTGRDVSGTARQAFGAVAIARPAGPATLALLLIHEFQHVKLGAVLDLYDLYDPSDTRLFHAPWRDDPRPLEGLLQGTYAHIAVSDYWRVRRSAGGDPAGDAAARFAHWCTGTAAAIDTLAASGSLTPLGEQFLAGMRNSVAPMLRELETARRPGGDG
jgi:uncharacterized protein